MCVCVCVFVCVCVCVRLDETGGGGVHQVGWLLANGAMLEAQNKYQWTPYDLAVRRGKDEVAELLLDEQRFKTLNGLP